MKVLAYPADNYGCGSHRLIWPIEELRRAGCDATVVVPGARQVMIVLEGDRVKRVDIPDDIDVVVFQRTTHLWLAGAVEYLRNRGTTVVIDVDDDLTAIHPSNPAFDALHPRYLGRPTTDGKTYQHSWRNVTNACRHASLVTVSAPALLPTYAAHGRGRVLHNYLAEHYYDVPHVDSDVIGWPASLHSHPNDPDVVGPAVARMVNAGATFRIIGEPEGCGRAFMLEGDPEGTAGVDLMDWPAAVAQLGIGITPLADTRFNGAKSWLKPLELAAVGVPWVGSPRTEYARLHAIGGGVLVDRPKDWYRALRELWRSPARRTELAEAGRAAAATLRLRNHAWRWWEAWADAYAGDRGLTVGASTAVAPRSSVARG